MTCTRCQASFEPTEEDRRFYEQLDVPEPKQCPQCRLIRRLLERNARKLYKRTCDFSGKTIVSTYLANRIDGEDFLATWRRVGPAPFKEALYGAA